MPVLQGFAFGAGVYVAVIGHHRDALTTAHLPGLDQHVAAKHLLAAGATLGAETGDLVNPVEIAAALAAHRHFLIAEHGAGDELFALDHPGCHHGLDIDRGLDGHVNRPCRCRAGKGQAQAPVATPVLFYASGLQPLLAGAGGGAVGQGKDLLGKTRVLPAFLGGLVGQLLREVLVYGLVDLPVQRFIGCRVAASQCQQQGTQHPGGGSTASSRLPVKAWKRKPDGHRLFCEFHK